MAADLLQRIARFLQSYSTPTEGTRLGVAVSGGADSVVLLRILAELAPSLGLDLMVLHVNHALRGDDSMADQRFVEDLSRSLGWPVQVHQGPVVKGSVEAEARRIRVEFFRCARLELGLRYIALGHTATDQAETVLFRMLRGTGLAGLAGMAPVGSNGNLRPLLTASRAEVRDYGRERGFSWREDASNLDLRFRRNRLRLQVLPDLTRHFNPRLEQVLAETAALARDEEQYWHPRIERLFRQSRRESSRPGVFLDVVRLTSLHRAVQRRLLRRAVLETRGDLRQINLDHVEAIAGLLGSSHGHDRVQVPGVDAFRSFDVLRLSRLGEIPPPPDYSVPVNFGTLIDLPGNAGRILVKSVTANASDCVTVKGKETSFADQAELDGEALDSVGGLSFLQIRNWQPGDSILLPGARVPVKLKTLFQEHRVLLWERREWPVLVAGGQIIWTRVFGCASGFAASATTRHRLQVCFYSEEHREGDCK